MSILYLVFHTFLFSMLSGAILLTHCLYSASPLSGSGWFSYVCSAKENPKSSYSCVEDLAVNAGRARLKPAAVQASKATTKHFMVTNESDLREAEWQGNDFVVRHRRTKSVECASMYRNFAFCYGHLVWFHQLKATEYMFSE